jgi:hypothetical protein
MRSNDAETIMVASRSDSSVNRCMRESLWLPREQDPDLGSPARSQSVAEVSVHAANMRR